MKLSPREKTKAVSIEVSDIPDRMYVKAGEDEVWISTSYGELTMGVVGGSRYKVRDKKLVDLGKKVGVLGKS